ncbi:hypothetical protein NPIL_602821 [Nephila pilipes]|uniref:Uncharacterized protein n=1 Tax=Nephila pilipes TaxID=299642 RepID=A0A8X6P1H0_NEPPI|nr:hypothetical protein NPIL_602821 [Nephila pilipes]
MSSPYPLRNRLCISESQVATGRTSPYLTRAGGVETARSRKSRFRPYKRRNGKRTAQEVFLNEEEHRLVLEQFANRQKTKISECGGAIW